MTIIRQIVLSHDFREEYVRETRIIRRRKYENNINNKNNDSRMNGLSAEMMCLIHACSMILNFTIWERDILGMFFLHYKALSMACGDANTCSFNGLTLCLT